MKFINLTPHVLNISTPTGMINLPPDGTVARVAVERKLATTISGIPAYRTAYGAVEGLPAPIEGTIFIVSAMVRNHPDIVFNRMDVASPGALIRDSEGKVVGCDGIDLG